eukprot:2342739-Pyramimonas_sp.AAC.1
MPADYQSWDLLPKLRPEDLQEAALTFPWGTSVGPTRLHPRASWYLPQPGLVALAALFTRCEHMLMWPSDKIVNEMVRLARPGGGTRLIILVESLVRLWSRARRPISRRCIQDHGSRCIWGNRRGYSSSFS